MSTKDNGNDNEKVEEDPEKQPQEATIEDAGAGENGEQEQKQAEQEDGDGDSGVAEQQQQQGAAPPPPEDTKTLLIDGLKIMFMDVTIQCCISLSIYLAVTRDGAVGYQLAALQSALPAYGFAYALGNVLLFFVVFTAI